MAIYVGDLEIKKIMLDGVELPDIAIGSIEIPVESGDTPVVSHTYYYQISGGTKQELTLTEFTTNEYGADIALDAGQKIRFYEDDTVIASASIQDITQIAPYGTGATFDSGEDNYLYVGYPLTRIVLIIDYEDHPYSVSVDMADVFLYIDDVPNKMEIDDYGSSYNYTTTADTETEGWYRVKANNTFYNLRANQENQGTTYYPSYCVDEGSQITISFDYMESTVDINIPEGINCIAPTGDLFIYADGGRVDYIEDCGSEVSFTYPEGTEVYVGYEDETHYEGLNSITVDGCEIGSSFPVTLPVEVVSATLCGGILDFVSVNGDYCSGGGSSDEPEDPWES